MRKFYSQAWRCRRWSPDRPGRPISVGSAGLQGRAGRGVAPMSWGGCYVGGNVGGVWGTKDWNVTGSGVPMGSHDVSGVIGGVQGGCNVQTGAVVFGIQGDYDWTGAKGSNADTFTSARPIKPRSNHWPRSPAVSVMPGSVPRYVKGGGAWVRDDYAVLGTPSGTASETRGGWTAGLAASTPSPGTGRRSSNTTITASARAPIPSSRPAGERWEPPTSSRTLAS